MKQTASTTEMEPLHRDYKTRNILTLEERVQVIRDFERNPVYQRLAEKYSCSSKQIKNIIANRETVLLYFSNRRTDASSTDERRRRQQKIAFLGQVIHEYIQRAVYHGVPLSDASVRQKALEVKESIAIMNFYPNHAWMQNFKTQYGLAEFDLMTLRQSMFLGEPKEESFKAVDIIQFVSRREKQEERRRLQRSLDEDRRDPTEPSVKYERDDDDSNSNSIHDNLNSGDDFGPPAKQPKCEPKDEGEPYDGRKSNDEREPNDDRASNDEQKSDDEREPPPLPDIGSYREALRHLKVLEDFAMLGENFRAIGLITQLQQVLRDPPKSDDFIA